MTSYRKWKTGCIVLGIILAAIMASAFLNRAKIMSTDYTGHHIISSDKIVSDDEEFLIVMVSDTFPNSTNSASVERVGDTLNVQFKTRNSLFPKIPFTESKNTFGMTGEWDHVFAFEVDETINFVIDKYSGNVIWSRE